MTTRFLNTSITLRKLLISSVVPVFVVLVSCTLFESSAPGKNNWKEFIPLQELRAPSSILVAFAVTLVIYFIYFFDVVCSSCKRTISTDDAFNNLEKCRHCGSSLPSMLSYSKDWKRSPIISIALMQIALYAILSFLGF